MVRVPDVRGHCAPCRRPRARCPRSGCMVYVVTASGVARQPALRSQPTRAARIAWWRLRCFDRAFSSTSLQIAAGKRTDRTTVRRVLPLPGCPLRRRTASAPSSGISHSARRDGPPRSSAPAKAWRRTGPKRSKSTSWSSTSVVLVVRFFMLRRLSRADDANRNRFRTTTLGPTRRETAAHDGRRLRRARMPAGPRARFGYDGSHKP